MEKEALLENLKKISQENKNYSKDKNNETIDNIYKITDSFYTELSNYIYAHDKLYDLVYNKFRKNIGVIFKNMDDYIEKTKKTAITNINELIKVGLYNKYVDAMNLTNLYNNFNAEINKTFNIDDKINVLVNTNTNSFTSETLKNLVTNNEKKVLKTIEKYTNLYIKEMQDNIKNKKENLLNLYQTLIDNILNDLYINNDEIYNKNMATLIDTTYLILKEKEYFNIEKYINDSDRFVKNLFLEMEKDLKSKGIKQKNKIKINPVIDSVLSFNNTIEVKSKRIFDEMNTIITLDDANIRAKQKDFADVITKIYSLDLVFDKQLLEYKKTYSVMGKNLTYLNETLKNNSRRLNETLKANLFNIYRDNTKVFNDVIYKMMALKANLGTYNTLLTKDKIKDLLLQ